MSITTANDDGGGESSAYLSLKSRFKISLICNSQMRNNQVTFSTSRLEVVEACCPTTFFLSQIFFGLSPFHPFCATKRVRSPRPTSETLSPPPHDSNPLRTLPHPPSPLARSNGDCPPVAREYGRRCVKKFLFRLRSK